MKIKSSSDVCQQFPTRSAGLSAGSVETQIRLDESQRSYSTEISNVYSGATLTSGPYSRRPTQFLIFDRRLDLQITPTAILDLSPCSGNCLTRFSLDIEHLAKLATCGLSFIPQLNSAPTLAAPLYSQKPLPKTAKRGLCGVLVADCVEDKQYPHESTAAKQCPSAKPILPPDCAAD